MGNEEESADVDVAARLPACVAALPLAATADRWLATNLVARRSIASEMGVIVGSSKKHVLLSGIVLRHVPRTCYCYELQSLH